jgi:hypothetical protein
VEENSFVLESTKAQQYPFKNICEEPNVSGSYWILSYFEG